MLKGALGKLISGGGSSGGTFDMTKPHGRLMAFFQEIENAAVPKRVSLTIGDAEMTFDMANKKVLRFIGVTPDSDGRGVVAAKIVRNYDDLDSQLKLLAELLTGFVSRAGDFDMVARTCPVAYPAKADGFSASEWRFACDLYGVVPADVVPEVPRSPTPPAAEPEAPAAPATPAPAPVAKAPPAAPAAPPARELVDAMAAAPQQVAAAAPARAPQAPAETETISSVIASLGTAPDVMPAAEVAPVVEAAPAPAPAVEVVVHTPRDPAREAAHVEKFYETVSKHCDLAMLLTEDGHVVHFTDDAAGWFDLGGDIAKDMKAWAEETAPLMPGCQMVMMRSPILQNQSIIFMTNGSVTAFGAFSSHVTGRIFSIANDFVGKKR